MMMMMTKKKKKENGNTMRGMKCRVYGKGEGEKRREEEEGRSDVHAQTTHAAEFGSMEKEEEKQEEKRYAAVVESTINLGNACVETPMPIIEASVSSFDATTTSTTTTAASDDNENGKNSASAAGGDDENGDGNNQKTDEALFNERISNSPATTANQDMESAIPGLMSAGGIRAALRERLVHAASRIRDSLMEEPALEFGGLSSLLPISWGGVRRAKTGAGRRRWLGLERGEWFDVVSEQAASHALLTALREEALNGEDGNVAGIEDVALVASRQLLVLSQSMQGALLAHDASKDLITRFFNSVHAEQVSSLRTMLRGVRHSLEEILASKHVALLVLGLYCTTATFSASAVSNPFARVRERQWALITEALAAASVSLPDIWYWARMAGNDGKQLFLKNFARTAASPFVGDRAARTFWIGLIEERLASSLEKKGCVPSGATANEAAVIAFFLYLGRIGEKKVFTDTRDIGQLPNASRLFEFIRSQPCVVWCELRDGESFETFIEIADQCLDWLPLADEIKGFSKGDADRRWALYATYVAGWHQNFNLLSGKAWDSSSVSEASQFLKGLRTSLEENCTAEEVSRLLDAGFDDATSGSWMKGVLGALTPARWRRSQNNGADMPIAAETLAEGQMEVPPETVLRDIDEDTIELEVELERVATAIARLEEMVTPLSGAVSGGEEGEDGGIEHKLKAARALVDDVKALKQHLTILSRQEAASSTSLSSSSSSSSSSSPTSSSRAAV